MYQEYNRKLILEDGSEYFGYAFGSEESRVCEMVFNTSMAGYQEILSDPSETTASVRPILKRTAPPSAGLSSGNTTTPPPISAASVPFPRP